MQNYEQILAECGVVIPEDKKEPLRKALDKNYKTIADYNKQVEKTKRYRSEIEEAQRKQVENQEAVELKEQIETLERQIQEEKDAHAREKNANDCKDRVTKFLSGKKFVNDITRSVICSEMIQALEADKESDLVKVFKGITAEVPNILIDDSKQKKPGFTTRFNQNQRATRQIDNAREQQVTSLSERMQQRMIENR